MKNNKTLLGFILGALSILAIIPIIESVVETICTFLELPKVKISKTILKGNQELQELQADLQERPDPFAVGFQIPSEEYYDDFDDFDDFDYKKKTKNKCGF